LVFPYYINISIIVKVSLKLTIIKYFYLIKYLSINKKMEFFIKKNATLPVLKINIIKDGRSDYDRSMQFLSETDIFFSMVNVNNDIPKITSRPAGLMAKQQLDDSLPAEYYVYYQFTPFDTRQVGRYKGQFLFRNNTGVLVLPLNEEVYINVTDSFIIDDMEYASCYVIDYPCCVGSGGINPGPGPSPTTTSTTGPTTTSTTSPSPTTTSTTIPQPIGYTEWVLSTGVADYEDACAKTDEWKTAYTPELNYLPIGQTLYSSPEFTTTAFSINHGFFKIMLRNGVPYDPSTIICVGPYNFYANNYCQVINSYECGTPIPCNSMTFTKTEDVPYSFVIYNCEGRYSGVTLNYNQSTTLCVSTYVPQPYITKTDNGSC
jgi:hypothetical protein